MKDKFQGLDFTDEEKAAVEKYARHVQEKRWQTNLRPFYAKVDAEFGTDLDQKTRQQLAEKLYGQWQADNARSRWARARETGK